MLSLASETHRSNVTQCKVTLNPQDQKILCRPQGELVVRRVYLLLLFSCYTDEESEAYAVKKRAKSHVGTK